MKKLIKADLNAILRLAGESRFLAADSLKLCAAKLCRQEHTDFLFLARTPWCWLFDFPAIYESGSCANLCTLACHGVPKEPVAALFFHIDKIVEGHPWGSVTLLDYPTAAQDIGVFFALPRPQRKRHAYLMVRRYTRNIRYCSVQEVLAYLKTGEVN